MIRNVLLILQRCTLTGFSKWKKYTKSLINKNNMFMEKDMIEQLKSKTA